MYTEPAIKDTSLTFYELEPSARTPIVPIILPQHEKEIKEGFTREKQPDILTILEGKIEIDIEYLRKLFELLKIEYPERKVYQVYIVSILEDLKAISEASQYGMISHPDVRDFGPEKSKEAGQIRTIIDLQKPTWWEKSKTKVDEEEQPRRIEEIVKPENNEYPSPSYAPSQIHELKEIDLEVYCNQVSSECDRMHAGVVPEQVWKVLGGLSCLYLETLLKLGIPELKVKTKKAFASEYVSLSTILEEIGNCAGTDRRRSNLILEAMQTVLRDNFKRAELTKHGEGLSFQPLGIFEVINLDVSSYLMIYTDPAAGNYKKFLL